LDIGEVANWRERRVSGEGKGAGAGGAAAKGNLNAHLGFYFIDAAMNALCQNVRALVIILIYIPGLEWKTRCERCERDKRKAIVIWSSFNIVTGYPRGISSLGRDPSRYIC